MEAASPSLLNMIHRFQLKKGYRTLYVKASKAVINHYKYQAWSEFKAKFRRRVSAYVVDWRESRNPGSQDRTPGLGNRAIKPHGWENMFCEENDTALKEYAGRVFSLSDEEEAGPNLEWQWTVNFYPVVCFVCKDILILCIFDYICAVSMYGYLDSLYIWVQFWKVGRSCILECMDQYPSYQKLGCEGKGILFSKLVR